MESRNVTYLSEDFPVFWEEARGANVRDADGNVYVDATAAFGVALAGHAHPRIVEAAGLQARRLPHGMGDVHPPASKVELMERLAALAPWPDARVVLASAGSEAVEIALKTALLATGRPGIVAFEGGYHGLTAGALAATARPFFREPFEGRLYPGVARVPWPAGDGSDAASCLAALEGVLEEGVPGGVEVGAVVLEPVQGRAGVRVPPDGFLGAAAGLAARHGALVIADEVFTGAGRCGGAFASGRLGLAPDIVCLGKALGGGYPLSACLARREVMDAWPASEGEALHTSTFLGHPVGCAAGLAVLDLLDEGLGREAERIGAGLLRALGDELGGADGPGGRVGAVRGLGAMVGVELLDPAGAPLGGAGSRVARAALARGLLVLPAGDAGHVVQLTPPAVLTDGQASFAVATLGDAVREVLA